jgi:N-acetylglucosaminyldiphosphoundecaprenol N-acetyl-beta-D-mannosaminyltransferase
MTLPPKSPVAGLPISMTSYDEVLQVIDRRPDDAALVIAFCNVHSVMSARRDSDLSDALRATEIATPDGVPLVWTLRRTGRTDQERVYGPDLMRLALVDAQDRGWKHYLYGSTPETLELLQSRIKDFAPAATIVGAYSPPFRPLTPEDEAADCERIRSSDADIVWVGLGMPKQELWMHRMSEQLPGVALAGVGAAFDFLAGTVQEAPAWMQSAGLEWLYRLAREPRRLWRRYVWNNPAFVFLVMRQLLQLRLRGASHHAEASDGYGTDG